MTAAFAHVRDLIERTDPDLPVISVQSLKGRDSSYDKLVIGELAHAARDAPTILTTLAVHDTLLRTYGVQEMLSATDEQVEQFVLDGSTLAAQHLRRNSLLSIHRVLALAGRCDPTTHLEAIRLAPIATVAPRPSRAAGTLGTSTRVQQDTATSDEILLMRLSCRFTKSRYEYRSPAAMAILSSGASPREGALVRWCDRVRLPGSPRRGLALPGAHLHEPTHGRHLAPRTVPLDAWEDSHLTGWQHEFEANGNADATKDDSRQSMIYTARGNPGTAAATMSFIKAFEVVRTAACLDGLPGTTPGAVSFWAAAHATVWQGLDKAAAIHGTDPANLLRKLTHVSDRAYPSHPVPAAPDPAAAVS